MMYSEFVAQRARKKLALDRTVTRAEIRDSPLQLCDDAHARGELPASSSVSQRVLRLRDFAHRSSPVSQPETATDADDVALVARLALDDGQALAALMDRYWRPMVGFALDKMRNQDAAEDLVQEAFVRVWERRRELRPYASPRAYLYRVLRNLITDDYRRRRLRDRFSFLRSLSDPVEVPSPLATLEASEFATAANRAVNSLPERRRDVFILAHLQGLSYREVAEAMGITPRTVANHMSLALTQLRNSLSAFTRPGRNAPRELPLSRESVEPLDE